MTYREFLNRVSDDDFADIILENAIFNIACVDSAKFNICKKKVPSKKCKPCLLRMLKSEVESVDN